MAVDGHNRQKCTSKRAERRETTAIGATERTFSSLVKLLLLLLFDSIIDEDHGLPGATARREYLLLDHSILWHRRLDHRLHAAGFHRRISSLVGWSAHLGSGEFLRRRNERMIAIFLRCFILLFSHKHHYFCLLRTTALRPGLALL